MTARELTCRRNIVVCSDGTGNAGGRGKGSNVWRIRQAVARDTGGHRNSQVVLYEDGVGTQTLTPIRFLGNAFGMGLTEDLKQLYGKLIREFNVHFEADDLEKKKPLPDQLYLFGFSRGAFAIRTLANILYHCGIADIHDEDGKRDTPENIDAIVAAAIDAYTRRARHPKAPEEFRQKYGIEWRPDNCTLTAEQVKGRFPIKFVGVWDTVDAVGLPFDNITERLTEWGWPLFRLNMRRRGDYTDWKDDDLHEWIENAYHAISVDDERQTFHPVLFREFDENRVHKSTQEPVLEKYRHDKSDDDTSRRHRRIEQVWFPGVHSNVGGGYAKDHMAYVSLNWMMCHARREGLKFDLQLWHEYEAESDVLGHMYNSRGGLGALYRYKPRSVSGLSKEVGLDSSIDEKKPLVHTSVFQRIAEGVTDYSPISLPLQGKYLEVDDPVEVKKTGAEKTAVEEPVAPGNSEFQRTDDDYYWRMFLSESTTVAHPHETKLTESRRQAQETTKNLVARRTSLFYAFYVWVISFVVVGNCLGTGNGSNSRGDWFESKGSEWYWGPYFGGFLAVGLVALLVRAFFTTAGSKRATIKTGYNGTRIIRNVFLLAAILILIRPLCIDLILWMVPGFVAPVISGIGESTIAVTAFGVAYYLISAAQTATIQWIREVNVSAWMNAMGVPAAPHRPTMWLKSTSMSDMSPYKWLGGFLERVVSPLLALTVVGLIAFGAIIISLRGVVTSSNVAGPRERKENTLSFVTSQILATGEHLKEGWQYKVTVAVDKKKDEPWKDGSLDATHDGLKETPTDKTTALFLRLADPLKRKPGEEYFQLLGSIGNPNAAPIVIKDGQPFTATKSGELFLYVNDLLSNTGTIKGPAR